MISSRIITTLMCIAVILLITCAVSAGLGLLLNSLDDQLVGKVVLQVVTGGCGLLLIVDLICLILALAVNAQAPEKENKPNSNDDE